jgi:hypothetical protein
MKNLIYCLRAAVPLTVAAIMVGSARADETAITFIAPPTDGAAGPGVGGWQFAARSDISILALGLYDAAGIYGGGFIGDGLREEHAVGIWDVSNPSTPLVSTLIPAGTLATLVDGFRYISTSPVVLPANHDYVIAALFSDAAQKDFTVGTLSGAPIIQVGPELELGGRRYGGSAAALVFPEYYAPGELFGFGPNFTYSVVAEPSTFGLCTLAAAALFASRAILPLRPGSAGPFRKVPV